MKAIRFDEVNKIYGKEMSVEFQLPVHEDPLDQNRTAISCWSLNTDELKKIQETGLLYLAVVTYGEPLHPVWMSIEKPSMRKIPPRRTQLDAMPSYAYGGGTVRAFQVGCIHYPGDGYQGAELMAKAPTICTVEVDAAFVEKWNPQVDDYLAVDGFGNLIMFPQEEFERVVLKQIEATPDSAVGDLQQQPRRVAT